MQRRQRWARIGAQLVGDAPPQPLVVPQCLGLAAAAAQREHQLSGQAFVQRVLGGPCDQPSQQFAVPAVQEGEVVACQFGGQPLGVERATNLVQPRRVQDPERVPVAALATN